jgi:hypothetical protein
MVARSEASCQGVEAGGPNGQDQRGRISVNGRGPCLACLVPQLVFYPALYVYILLSL